MASNRYSGSLSDLPSLLTFVKQQGREMPVLFHLKDAGSFTLATTLLSELLNYPSKHHDSLESAIDAASSLSLFDDPKIHICSDISSPIPQVSFEGCFFLASTSKKSALSDSVALIDFTGEKPWDTPKRISAWASQLLQRKGISISTQALQLLVQGCVNDPLQLWQEIEKLSLYAMESKSIDEASVRAVCTFVHSEKEWQIAEDIIWESSKAAPSFNDSSALHRFIGLLRYHLTLGVNLASSKNPHETLQQLYPKLTKKGEKRYLPKLQEKKTGYFIQGHALLANLETQLKTAMLPLQHVWESFVIELRRIS